MFIYYSLFLWLMQFFFLPPPLIERSLRTNSINVWIQRTVECVSSWWTVTRHGGPEGREDLCWGVVVIHYYLIVGVFEATPPPQMRWRGSCYSVSTLTNLLSPLDCVSLVQPNEPYMDIMRPIWKNILFFFESKIIIRTQFF